jgi:hypothetical protein
VRSAEIRPGSLGFGYLPVMPIKVSVLTIGGGFHLSNSRARQCLKAHPRKTSRPTL